MYRFIKILLISFLFLSQNIIFAKEHNSVPEKIEFVGLDWVPMLYEKEGIPQGLFVEILSEIMEKHLKKELKVKFYPWKRAQEVIKVGKSDFMITVATKDRLKYSIKSEQPFFLLYLNVYTYKNHPKINQINQIKSVQDIIDLNLKVVTNLGNGWHKKNLENKGVDTKYISTQELSLRFLSRKRADIMIDTIVTTNHIIKERNLTSKIALTKSVFGPIKMHLLMSKKSKYIKLMPEINRVFKELQKKGVIKKIIDKYSTLN